MWHLNKRKMPDPISFKSHWKTQNHTYLCPKCSVFNIYKVLVKSGKQTFLVWYNHLKKYILVLKLEVFFCPPINQCVPRTIQTLSTQRLLFLFKIKFSGIFCKILHLSSWMDSWQRQEILSALPYDKKIIKSSILYKRSIQNSCKNPLRHYRNPG